MLIQIKTKKERLMMGGDFHAARCVPTFIEITEITEIGRKFREYRLGC
jgi:hypothetical protein